MKNLPFQFPFSEVLNEIITDKICMDKRGSFNDILLMIDANISINKIG